MNTSYDADFKSVSGLNWLPWVGNKFDTTKLLILGDSHYDDNDGWLIYDNATREFVKNQGLNSDKPEFQKRQFFNQIEKMALDQSQTSYEDRINFWNSVTFLNLVQRLLPSRQERPTDLDFDESWQSFLKVASILKPKYCIKLGIDGVGRLGNYLNEVQTDWKRADVQEFYKKPFAINLTNNEHKMKIIFVNHPTGSFGFSIKEWTDFIKREIPDLPQLITRE